MTPNLTEAVVRKSCIVLYVGGVPKHCTLCGRDSRALYAVWEGFQRPLPIEEEPQRLLHLPLALCLLSRPHLVSFLTILSSSE